MRAVDTNVLVRLVTRDDAKQAERADQFVARGAWVSHLVLAETTWVLSAVYQLDAGAIATAVEMLLSHEAVSIADPDVVRAALENFRRKPALGFSDCLILEVARAAGHTPLGTFDRTLGRLDGAQRL
jgi:predicted nucleic-acid-binding protein